MKYRHIANIGQILTTIVVLWPAWLIPTHQNSKLLLMSQYTTVTHILFYKFKVYVHNNLRRLMGNTLSASWFNSTQNSFAFTCLIGTQAVNVGRSWCKKRWRKERPLLMLTHRAQIQWSDSKVCHQTSTKSIS